MITVCKLIGDGLVIIANNQLNYYGRSFIQNSAVDTGEPGTSMGFFFQPLQFAGHNSPEDGLSYYFQIPGFQNVSGTGY